MDERERPWELDVTIRGTRVQLCIRGPVTSRLLKHLRRFIDLYIEWAEEDELGTVLRELVETEAKTETEGTEDDE